MAGNSFGKYFVLSTFGESHGGSIGGIIDGCPAGLQIDLKAIQQQLDKRKPGQSRLTTQRKESDEVAFHSGIFEGKTLGTPIGFSIINTDAKSKDYEHIKNQIRPSHADNTYLAKYGLRDYRGGGRASARETACRVVAGAIAQQLLATVKITAYVSSVGPLSLDVPYQDLDFSNTEKTLVRCPHLATAEKFENFIDDTRKKGDSIGGIITCVIKGAPVGWGEPVFDKLHADLGKAMLSINAVKGFEYGSGFAGTTLYGSQHNDQYNKDGTLETNHSGGVQGGISNGEDIYFNVAFKPTATIMQNQQGVDVDGNPVTVKGKGRHDPCVVPRAVPIVEAMAALVLVNNMLASRLNKI